ncbi:MAG: hypothetical protein JF590_02345 [Gemmatimonadetes bacterium]|nr:hypothetical protein [Gemmatimonadota bacterium]
MKIQTAATAGGRAIARTARITAPRGRFFGRRFWVSAALFFFSAISCSRSW